MAQDKGDGYGAMEMELRRKSGAAAGYPGETTVGAGAGNVFMPQPDPLGGSAADGARILGALPGADPDGS